MLSTETKIPPFWRCIANRWLVILFVLISLVSGLRLVYATPMGQVADEPSHDVRAAALLHGAIIGSKFFIGPLAEAGVRADRGLILAGTAEMHNDGKPALTKADRAAARAIPWANYRILIPSGSMAYLPTLYIPGALGIGVGGIIGFGPLQALYLGRAFMLIAFVLIGAASLWFARSGRGIFFTLLSLPMTVSLAASFNQDGMIIASCALAGALLTMDENLHPKSRWFAAAIIAVVICSKPPYGLLLFCAALPIAVSGSPRRLIAAALFGLPALAWMFIVSRTTLIPREIPAYHPGPLWPGNPNVLFTVVDANATIRVLLHNPALIITLPYDYIIFYLGALRDECIGLLGWLNVRLPHWLYGSWSFAILAALLGALFAQGRGARRWRLLDALFVLAITAATIIAICLSLYLSWTPVGAAMIEGVQGRYFLPLAAFIPLILPRMLNHPRFKPASSFIEIASVIPAILLAIYDIGALPALISARFG